MKSSIRSKLLIAAALLLLAVNFTGVTNAQTEAPYTSPELVGLLNRMRQDPSLIDTIIEGVRRRGIGFPLTEGLLSLAATRSANNSILRRTLEEAERRRANPVEHALPNAAEADALLAKSRAATLEAAGAMPDFLVKQLITRSYSNAGVSNWQVYDHLTVAVSYRAELGEQYHLLSKNGVPAPQEGKDASYQTLGDFTSTGEFVSRLANLFADKSKTVFRAVDTDVLRSRRTLVYEYSVLKQNSTKGLRVILGDDFNRSVITAIRGRLWVDRETSRVLRFEVIATEFPLDFPVKASYDLIDYDWVTISAKKYLLPTDAEAKLEFREPRLSGQNRNEIRFRNYQKFSTDVRILDDDDEVIDETTPAVPDEKAPPAKPEEIKPPLYN
ncbi:MAG: hypothetical protein ABIP75_10225 [Pyrinomonadaceae bacterium]